MPEVLHSPTKPARHYHLDLIRGIAVLIMITAHGIDYYHDGSSLYLRIFVLFANTVCFGIFLLVSGAVAYIAYLNRLEHWTTIYKRLKHRLLMFLISYYLIALFSVSDKIISSNLIDRWKLILKIIFFQVVPSYTEFLLPFLGYSLLLIAFRKPLLKLARDWRKSILLGILLYIAGYLIYSLPCPDFLIPWKALLAGHQNIFRFPLLQYAPVYLAGISWGEWLIRHPHMHGRQEKAKNLTIYLSASSLLIAVIYAGFHNINGIYHRWPPSIVFILLGMIAFFALTYLIDRAYELRRHAFIRDSLLLFGQNTFALYWAHIFILKLYHFSNGTRVDSPLLTIGLIIILLVTSLALATFIPFNFSFNLTFIRERSGRPFSHYEYHDTPTVYQLADDVSHKPHILSRAGFVIVAILLFMVTISFYGVTKEQIIQAKQPNLKVWWSRDWAYKRSIDIKNINSFTNLQKGTVVSMSFNHRELVDSKKSSSSGNDIRIIYYDGKRFFELPTRVETPWNDISTTVNFNIYNAIGPGQSSHLYYLYYGNNLIDRADDKSISLLASDQADIKLLDENSMALVASVSKIWNLKQDGFTKSEPLSLTAQLVDQAKSGELVNYEVVGTDLRGQMLPISSNKWEVAIDAQSLPAGSYRVRAFLDGGSQSTFSQNAGFIVSYPLYITWSFDWEGYDPSQSYLQAAGQIAEDHHIPITQFFNPRVYTAPDISERKKQDLTDWVKDRRDKFGDEIDLHLHMFPDFVASAGITPKTSPTWDFNKDGYGILTTAYNYEEMLTIINRAKQFFEQYGLGTPIAYRAGAWYANEDTLRAIQDAGLLVDSSGRTKYAFGPKKVPGFWDLSSTTKPYQPSTTNQNSPNPSPNLNILEIPNNGADSYANAFSLGDMIKRFDDNFNGSPLSEKQQITYLSHYQWFNGTEPKKVTELFNYVDHYLNDKDLGPVKYVTTGQVYQAWMGN